VRRRLDEHDLELVCILTTAAADPLNSRAPGRV
jgi:hypothetical protein